MIKSLLKYGFCVIGTLAFSPTLFAQAQTCPANINFSFGALTHWDAYTGNNGNGAGNGPNAIKQRYDSTQAAPTGTIGAVTIPEYNLSVNGIQVITTPGTDPYGSFSTIPTINGYAYNYSVLLGSTSIRTGQGPDGGGYIRGISYSIKVPPGPPGTPYTITYAYAMVLENGSHTNVNQPMFTATVVSADSIFHCASATYHLPTVFAGFDNRGDSAFALNQDSARKLGFNLSSLPSPNANGNRGESPYRVWTKGWTEVTFDLAAYRGQTVSLIFEADNCIPGGHFAYAYVAVRDLCAGLLISGPAEACINTNTIYSIPALAGATYEWEVPAGWSIVSGSNSNILTVKPVSTTGQVIAHEVNGCANLRDTLDVTVKPATIAGNVTADNEVCTGINSSPLVLGSHLGNVLHWIYSTDGIHYDTIPGAAGTTSYTALNLDSTTIFRTLVQNGTACSIDTSGAATITVDPKSVAGQLNPANMNFCLGQFKDATLTLKGKVGAVQYWQSSVDGGSNWIPFSPAIDTSYDVPPGTTQSTQYRSIVKSGVCPTDTSSIAYVTVIPVPFPQATIAPIDTTICYDDTAQLRASVSIGTSYNWTNTNTLTGPNSGTISSTPFSLTNGAHPLRSTFYVLNILNAGCPNPLRDTFNVHVRTQVIVNAGNDTAIVYNQPLQLNATSNYTNNVFYNWTPGTGLNSTTIDNPIATLGINIDSVRYTVKVTDEIYGCFGTDDILVRVFKTLPDIFVPNAFTPGKGTNSLFRPIPVGIVSLDYFRVYNRWGQLVYSTTTIGQGWDGTVNGVQQATGSFVWLVQGKDYTGKTIAHKGTMVLIR